MRVPAQDGHLLTHETGHLATPEKALFDSIYLLAPRGGHMHLPELELTHDFAGAELASWTARIADPRMRTLVRRGLDLALSGARH